MKFIFRGMLKDEKMPVGELPENAVKFKEPSNQITLQIMAFVHTIPAFLLVVLIVLVKSFLTSSPPLSLFEIRLEGLILSLLSILPHEFLHGICFLKSSEVHMFFMFGGMCVTCTDPISRARFVFMSILPNFVFGFLPLIIWIFMPYSLAANILFSLGLGAVLCGGGDFMNIFNAFMQMPKGALQQLSGFNSYWFHPQQPAE